MPRPTSRTPWTRSAADTRTGEAGTSPVTAVFGVAIFLGFVLLATQTLTHLYATSIVTSAAFETARHLAAEDGGGCAGARPRATSLLGRHADTAQVACRDDGDRLAVRIVAQSPARLFTRIDPIDRAATVRIEQRR